MVDYTKHPQHPLLLSEKESESKKPCDVMENKADEDLHKYHIQKALATLYGNFTDVSPASVKNSSKTEFSVGRCPFHENSLKKRFPHVSYIRGSPTLSTLGSTYTCEESIISVVGENSQLNPKRRLCFDEAISESDFYPSDVAFEMLERDEEIHIKENLIKVDLDCCSCSSWSVRSEKNASEISLHLDSDKDESRRKRVSIGEFMRARTEYLGSLSNKPFRERPYFGSDVVTPFSKDKILSSTPATKSAVCFLSDDFAKQSISSELTHTFTQETSCALPILWNRPWKREPGTKEGMLEEVYLILGIEQHQIEERNSTGNENVKWSDKIWSNDHLSFPQKVNESSGFPNCVPMKSQMEESLTSQSSFETDESTNNSMSLCKRETAVEFWTIQPQELTIDMNKTSSRLSLINKSTQDLKFKTKFDGRVINVCPVSGILPAKDQVELRLLVSPFIKKMKKNGQDIMTVICGKTEKKVIINVCKGRKPTPEVKKRSYMCF